VRPGWVCTLDAMVPDTGAYDDDEEAEGTGGGGGRTPGAGPGQRTAAEDRMEYSYLAGAYTRPILSSS
jgi:hypothetical protein